mgnify:FL=1
MDKKIFLLDKSVYKTRPSVTESDLEKWIAEEDYEDNYSIIKIDADNMSQTITETIKTTIVCGADEYFIFLFGYDFKEELEKYSVDFLKDFIDKNYNIEVWYDIVGLVLEKESIENTHNFIKDFMIETIMGDFTLTEFIETCLS